MYAVIIFLYYFNDNNGALMVALTFLLVTLIGSVFATRLSEIWYGIGLVAGAASGFIFGYLRIRYLERNIDQHIFCNGDLIRSGYGKRPEGMVFNRRENADNKERKRRKTKG